MDEVRGTGDVVRTATTLGRGELSVESVLAWLGDVIRPLRVSPVSPCGPAGAFVTAAAKGTVEIRPTGALAAGRVLDFRASPELVAAVTAADPSALGALADESDVATAFARALALELKEKGRAQVGNLGVWSLGRLPDLTVFVRFRAHPASSRMF